MIRLVDDVWLAVRGAFVVGIATNIIVIVGIRISVLRDTIAVIAAGFDADNAIVRIWNLVTVAGGFDGAILNVDELLAGSGRDASFAPRLNNDVAAFVALGQQESRINVDSVVEHVVHVDGFDGDGAGIAREAFGVNNGIATDIHSAGCANYVSGSYGSGKFKAEQIVRCGGDTYAVSLRAAADFDFTAFGIKFCALNVDRVAKQANVAVQLASVFDFCAAKHFDFRQCVAGLAEIVRRRGVGCVHEAGDVGRAHGGGAENYRADFYLCAAADGEAIRVGEPHLAQLAAGGVFDDGAAIDGCLATADAVQNDLANVALHELRAFAAGHVKVAPVQHGAGAARVLRDGCDLRGGVLRYKRAALGGGVVAGVDLAVGQRWCGGSHRRPHGQGCNGAKQESFAETRGKHGKNSWCRNRLYE